MPSSRCGGPRRDPAWATEAPKCPLGCARPMSTWRVTVEGEAEKVEAVKETFYKKLLSGAGGSVTFELPESDEAGADEIVKAAEKADLKATKESYTDPLDDAAPVDFF